jgi:hypothetical protein
MDSQQQRFLGWLKVLASLTLGISWILGAQLPAQGNPHYSSSHNYHHLLSTYGIKKGIYQRPLRIKPYPLQKRSYYLYPSSYYYQLNREAYDRAAQTVRERQRESSQRQIRNWRIESP